MSILAAYTPNAAPSTIEIALNLAILTSIFVAPIFVWKLGVFRRGAIRGPVRVDSATPIGPLLVVTVIGGLVWILLQVGYVSARSAAFAHAHPQQKFDASLLSNFDFAFLSTVPFVVGFCILLIGDASISGQMIRRMGYTAGKIAPGIGKGIAAMFVVLPLVWASSVVLEQSYQYIHFKHPAEHELLGAMKDAPLHIRVILVLGACVIAPVFEEFLFRGHLQTILVRFFTPSPAPQLLAPMAVAVEQTAGEPLPALPPLSDLSDARIEPPIQPSARARWMAVLLTSLAFALFHPPWMAPLIFVLAICLGYAY